MRHETCKLLLDLFIWLTETTVKWYSYLVIKKKIDDIFSLIPTVAVVCNRYLKQKKLLLVFFVSTGRGEGCNLTVEDEDPIFLVVIIPQTRYITKYSLFYAGNALHPL
jgi:hypothetical protein